MVIITYINKHTLWTIIIIIIMIIHMLMMIVIIVIIVIIIIIMMIMIMMLVISRFVGKGQRGSALMGSLQVSIFFDRGDFWGYSR